MVFSSPIFLYLFLPLLLGIYFLLPGVTRNVVLLMASLLFYAWGEPFFVLLLLLSVSCNYLLGLGIARWSDRAVSRALLVLAVAVNLGLLLGFKYLKFFSEIFGLQTSLVSSIHLPLGISFFTFQALSYVLDVHRGQAAVERNPVRLALYISLFPQLIAGPIVRYRDIAEQLVKRSINLEKFAFGVRRFTVGLGKKMLIGNVVAVPADAIFALPAQELTTGLAWLAAICFTLQIYFDFSGYSDMAIGLSAMFGFKIPENFNYPYIALSMQEFWRRWHITLSTWFRDYLYIPLGGSRCSRPRVAFNLLTVFVLCGLWHGAAWKYVVWGLYHGFFLGLERLRGDLVKGRLFQHIYVLTVVMFGWILFRAETLDGALAIMAGMLGQGVGTESAHTVATYLNTQVILAGILGLIGSTSVSLWRPTWLTRNQDQGPFAVGGRIVTLVILALILLLSSMQMAAGTHSPFIYFRF